MKYEAVYLCDVCGHRWKTYYNKISSIEDGDICENCMNRPGQKDFKGCVVEPHFYRNLDNEAGRNT
jgi:DNA replicative helicase MCM subunit Mcm2 (Cdc46/Mcm family)